MGSLLWFLVALAVLCAGGLGLAIVKLLHEIVGELRHIRKHLQAVSSEFEKVSGPLGYVQKIYGLGEKVLGRAESK